MKHQHRGFLPAVLGLLAAGLVGCGAASVPDGFDDPDKSFSSINGGVTVGRDARVNDLQSVNGRIWVHSDSEVGDVSNVNGSTVLEAGVKAKSLQSVNGSIRVEGVEVLGDLRTVNGGVFMGEGSVIGGDVWTINGGIRIVGARVKSSVVTTSGDISLQAGTVVDGDLYVKNAVDIDLGGVKINVSRPRIVLHDGVTVAGKLRFEREVELWVHDKARIGEVIGATVQHFSGDAPPRD